MQSDSRLGPLLLYSTSPSPSEAIAIAMAADHAGNRDSINVVILQTALEVRSDSLVADLHEQFSGQGVQLKTVDPHIQERADAFSSAAIELIREANLILISGGDPARVVRIIQDSPAHEALREASASGAVLAGCSAGAMVFGEGFLDGPRDNPRPTALLAWLPGIVIAPHLGHYPIEPWISAWPGKSILCLPDESVVSIANNGTEIRSLGPIAAQLFDPTTGIYESISAVEPQRFRL